MTVIGKLCESHATRRRVAVCVICLAASAQVARAASRHDGGQRLGSVWHGGS